MADKFWVGKAPAVAQITTVQITAYDAATTYIITINGITVSVVGTTDVNGTAAALQAALALETHPYFAAITWTVLTDTVTGTATVPGVPLTYSSSVSGGTGTIGAATTSTASAGPNDWSTPANWSDGSVPASTDNVTLADTSDDIAWGLDQNSVTLGTLRVMASYAGRIGLDRIQFATSVDAQTTDAAANEYRQHYLKIKWGTLIIGEHTGPDTPAGSERLKFHSTQSTGGSTTVIHNTASSSADTGKPAIRFLLAESGADMFIRSAPGGVGVAVDEPEETSTVGTVSISDTSTASKVFMGEGAAVGGWEQNGGTNLLQSTATMTAATAKGGTLTIEGDFTITTLKNDGADIIDNHIKTSGAAVTTAQLNAGTTDTTQSNRTRTYTNVNLEKGAAFIRDEDVLTLTNGITPKGRTTIQAA